MNQTILVIEDNEQVRENIEDILFLENFKVITAENGQSGLYLAKAVVPDLILCDIMMPKLDGYGVLAQLRKEPSTATIPLIFLTAKADRLYVRQGMELGADDYITKPFTHKELIAAIATRLDKQALVTQKNQRTLNELRTSITHSLPHELRTPLNGIMGFSQLLISEIEDLDREEIQEMAQSIKTASERLYRLIQNFLLYANLEVIATDSERVEALRSAQTSSATVIMEQAYQTANEAHRAKDLTLDLQESSVQIAADKLAKIVAELLDNAFKFSEPGTPVTIKSRCEEQFRFSISDRGKGMTSEQISQVGAYRQFERKLYEQQGSGLGLAIAQRLVQLHNGQLTIDSSPKSGTIVQVCLPTHFEGGNPSKISAAR